MKQIYFPELNQLHSNITIVQLQQKPSNKEEESAVQLDLSVLAQEKLESLKNAQLELTGDDYTKVVNDFIQEHNGMHPNSASENIIFKKNNNKYNWKFEYAGVPFDSEKGIIKLVENNNNKVMKYQYLCDEVTYCQFTLEAINDNQNFIELPKEEKANEVAIEQPLAIVKKGNIAYFKQQFGMYPPPVQQRFKNDKLVICTLGPININSEIDFPGNDHNKKETSATTIINYLLYKNDDITNLINQENLLWVMDKNGKLYTSTTENGMHHSYFLKTEGYGKPVACGGHMSIKNGKVTMLNDGSGHYTPNSDQLLLAAHFLYKQGVLDENVIVNVGSWDKNNRRSYNLADIAQINTQDILGKYSELV
ncbi:hypothetical protein Trichorick_00392 [Candidatus Trichorickettsia mobilis]|uniref:Phosphodiester glycosidase domain-containing protein n=1 Tax=Candidatus Trichorickettsia mobilis TaxID=1346319 RepID=A0ABZ0UR46_9RICK|nr:hypothetical protein [Candidatus Trichorickettsia mobilis]WPY00514.1 hypothetical protein Trichorick_00392 [Candidatus Trichorickettsia mobilis]